MIEEKEAAKALKKFYSEDNGGDFTHAYLYLRFLDLYVQTIGRSMNLVDGRASGLEDVDPDIHELIRGITYHVGKASGDPATNTYHGKILPQEKAVSLIKIGKKVNLTNLEQVIPYKLANNIILENPDSIAVLPCACRRNQSNPCQPIDVCLFVGEPWVSFLVEHRPDEARRVTQDEAAEIIRGEHARGHVHTAFFKKELGNRYYAICNCCVCCCLALKAWNYYQVPSLASSGYVASIEGDCTGCGLCGDRCPFGAIMVDEGLSNAKVNGEKCMGCGVCVDICPAGAISLKRDKAKTAPLDIEKLAG
jgi:ferredoxin